MQTETIIIGQGLSGSWLSWWLRQSGHDCIVIDEDAAISSSRIASGVINPVTGRVLAKTWMAETLIPFALKAYQQLGNSLGINCIQSSRILHSFPTPQMKEAFEKRLPEIPEYLSIPDHPEQWHSSFDSHYGMGCISPALLIDLNHLLSAWKNKLLNEHRLQLEKFNPNELSVHTEGVTYKGISAKRIIFCNGIQSMDLTWFRKLPFSPNKGEALLVEIPGLPSDTIYKKGLTLVPYPHLDQQRNNHLFWAGSTYENRFQHEAPTPGFKQRTEAQLQLWLKLPFKTLHHWAAIRPATVERRPFVGMHPYYPQIGLLNGMGTKGCSLAPYFGKQLADHIIRGEHIQPEASIARFSSLLRP